MPSEPSSPCPACGAPMDETATYCRQCRTPRPGLKTDGGSGVGLWLLIVIVAGGVIATVLKVAGLLG